MSGRNSVRIESGARRVEEIAGKAPKGSIFGPSPWYVWKVLQNDKARYVVLSIGREVIVPGNSTAVVQVLDAAAKPIASWPFQAGYRMTPASASIHFSPETGSDLIAIEMTRYINGFTGDQLLLVRIENGAHQAVQNEYVFPNTEIGIIPTAKTVQEWLACWTRRTTSPCLPH